MSQLLTEDVTVSSLADATPAMQLLPREKAEVLAAFGQRIHVLLPSAVTGGAVTIFESEVPPGGGPPYHVHRNEDETFFIRQGRFEFIINGERHEVGPGDVVYGPRNVPHTFRNIGDETGIKHVLTISANFETFFRACAHAFAEAAEQGPDMEKIMAIAAQSGLEFLPPDAPPVEIPAGANKPRIIHEGECEVIAYPGGRMNALVSEAFTGGEYAVVTGAAAPGDGPPPHIHSREDEIFLINEGEIAFGSGRDGFIAGPGDVVWAPRGTRHIFRCVSSTPASGLIVLMPGAFVGYFRDVATLFGSGQACPDNVARLFEKYGLEAIAPDV